uniref:Uncharacterized protein n=1 Tax=Sphaeramia orbicularis TaxID=375764 RepID=A0A673CAQ0_9TELE
MCVCLWCTHPMQVYSSIVKKHKYSFHAFTFPRCQPVSSSTVYAGTHGGQVATMSGRRLQFGVAVLDGRLYVVGGRDGLKTLNTVECYNPHSKTCERHATHVNTQAWLRRSGPRGPHVRNRRT